MSEEIVTIDWNGQDLIEALHAFQDDVSNSVVRTAVRDAANEAVVQLQAAAPHRTGKLSSAISVRTRISGGVARADVVVNVRGKASDPNNAFYWRFVEFGHRKRPNKEGASRGYVPGLAFIRNTWLRLQSTISNLFFTALDRAVNKTYTKI